MWKHGQRVLECGVIPVAKIPRHGFFVAAFIHVVDGANLYRYLLSVEIHFVPVIRKVRARNVFLAGTSRGSIIFRPCKSTFFAADRFVVIVVFCWDFAVSSCWDERARTAVVRVPSFDFSDGRSV